MNDLEWAKWFKQEFGITPTELQMQIKKSKLKREAKFEAEILKYTGHPNGFHPNAYRDIQINWKIIAREEAKGYDWPDLPWLPAPCERVGKSYYELNKLTFERREHYKQLNTGG